MHANFETVEEFLIADVVSCPKLVKNGRESKKYNQSKESGHLLQGSGNMYCAPSTIYVSGRRLSSDTSRHADLGLKSPPEL